MNTRSLFSAALLLASLSATALGQEYVRVTPDFKPNGDANRPWNSVFVGTWAAAGGELVLNANEYYETGKIDPAAKMMITTTGGPSRIGTRDPIKTSLRVASYNTHLFGNPAIPGLPRWMDVERTPPIAHAALDENADVFLFQEVWDGHFFEAIRDITDSVYTSGFYGGDREGASVLNSGLFTISKHFITNPYQFFYEAEDGFFEAMASKGYIRTSFMKGVFPVTVFNTHLQSGYSSGNIEARQNQLAELSAAVSVWRSLYPSHVVIVAGDFNTVDGTAEFDQTVKTYFGDFNSMGDGARNVPVAGNGGDCTTCYENDLRQYFDADNTANWRIDFILYANSKDGLTRVVPKAYNVRKYQLVPGHPILCDDGLCTRDLSDHYGIVLDLELQRPLTFT
jgi:endonuclease/exonuclease/phosphatase family metal-dependent hydrolase